MSAIGEMAAESMCVILVVPYGHHAEGTPRLLPTYFALSSPELSCDDSI